MLFEGDVMDELCLGETMDGGCLRYGAGVNIEDWLGRIDRDGFMLME